MLASPTAEGVMVRWIATAVVGACWGAEALAACDPELVGVLVVGDRVFSPPCTLEAREDGEAIVDGLVATDLLREYHATYPEPVATRPTDPYFAMAYDRTQAIIAKVQDDLFPRAAAGTLDTRAAADELSAFLLAQPYVVGVELKDTTQRTPGNVLLSFGVVTNDCTHPAAPTTCMDGIPEYFGFDLPGQQYPDPFSPHFTHRAAELRARQTLREGGVILLFRAGSVAPPVGWDGRCIASVVTRTFHDASSAAAALEGCGVDSRSADHIGRRLAR